MTSPQPCALVQIWAWMCSSHHRLSEPPLELHLPEEGLLHPGSLFSGGGNDWKWAVCPGYSFALQVQCLFSVNGSKWSYLPVAAFSLYHSLSLPICKEGKTVAMADYRGRWLGCNSCSLNTVTFLLVKYCKFTAKCCGRARSV